MRPALLLLAAVLLAAGAVLAHGTGPGATDASSRETRHTTAEGADRVAGPTLIGVARGPRVTPAAGIDEGGCVESTPAEKPFLLTVHVRHALHGQEVNARWNVARRVPSCAGPPPRAAPTPEELAEQQRAEEEQRRAETDAQQRWEAGFVRTGEATNLVDQDVRGESVDLALDLPSGLLSLYEPTLLLREVAYATRYEAVIPVVEEAVLDVHVTGPDGTPAGRACVERAFLGEIAWRVEEEQLQGGVLRVRGLPHLAGEEVHLCVRGWPDAEEPEVVACEDEPPRHPTRVPRDRAQPWVLHVQLTEWGGESACGWTLCCGGGRRRGAEPTGKPEELGDARLLLRDARGARVLALPDCDLSTDDRCAVLRDGLLAGSRHQAVSLPGYLRFEGTVEVVAGATVEAELREPVGGRLDAEVVDATGRSLPGARVHVDETRWFDVTAGVARLDAITDEAGRRVLQRVQPGRCTVRASWGGRRAEASIEIRDGETTKVTLVAR